MVDVEAEESGCSGIAISLSESLGCDEELFSVVQKYHFLGIGLCFFILLYFYFWFIVYSLDYLNEGNTRLIRINCRWRMCYS